MTFENQYNLQIDSRWMRTMLGMTQRELASALGLGEVAVARWESGQNGISAANLEAFYRFLYERNIRINSLKEQFYREDLGEPDALLFHGSKEQITGSVNLTASRENNDFGKGFYCGETFRQAALFVSGFEKSCVYAASFRTEGLNACTYQVDREWLLAIAAYRGRLPRHMTESARAELILKAEQADYIIAPIADNRMFQIIDSFLGGEITDEQCVHCLAATNLGKQYVLKSKAALQKFKLLERCYLCEEERTDYAGWRADDLQSAEEKVRAARVRYRGKGKYFDELF